MWHIIKYLLYAITSGIIIVAVATIGVLVYFNEELPDHLQLAEYSPATISRLYATDGTLIQEYARQQRIFVPSSAIPPTVRHAFLAAEDRKFYSHPGIDLAGIIRALWNNVVLDKPLQGASTITQQVAKNMLLSHERTVTRKIKEMILSFRISRTFTKDQVLELYLNEIYLGAGSYGVAAAALNYFNKSVDELTIEEAALLAAMPKAPTSYNPRNNYDRALERRNWVITAMAQEGFINYDASAQAISTPIRLESRDYIARSDASYFSEEVRRRLLTNFGKQTLYDEGLVVHTTLDATLQALANTTLRKGLIDYDKRNTYRGAIANIPTYPNWQEKLVKYTSHAVLDHWMPAVVLSVNAGEGYIEIGLPNGDTSYMTLDAASWQGNNAPTLFFTGDIILVEETDNNISPYMLRQVPEVNGAIVAVDPHTGKVLAMSGGFSFKQSKFNRATQAKRQPGSAFKPFVYLAAMEQGFTPADLIADEPIEFFAPKEENSGVTEDELPNIWAPQNYSGNFYGPTTLRKGLEKSLNVMTVHLALSTGIDKILHTAQRFGLYDEIPPRNMAAMLGAAETDLLSLTTAYAMLANGGKHIVPALIERIQDRHGKMLFRRDARDCPECMTTVNFQGLTINPPSVEKQNDIITDPRSAYQVISMLEGVVQRGTGKRAKAIGKPVAGKTGTTNNSIDSWFIGFSPDIVVGVYVGFDQPKTLGEKEEGATIALPIFVDFMKEALKENESRPFPIPEGIKMVTIDAKTGFLPSHNTRSEDVIVEAFKSGTEPKQVLEETATLPVINPPKALRSTETTPPQWDAPVTRGTGGIY